MVAALWLVQSKNLLLARTTYERFSNSANLAYSNMYGEIVSPHSDRVSLRNCLFMCFKCEYPSQENLRETHMKERFQSNGSLLSSSCALEIDEQLYSKLEFKEGKEEIREI
eukprot:TRINITY_DN9803_c0_g2_i3.p6 TRINITY_DN9803_c0_g2~~TRINITY_DN9803_c0_g2_i3.p6  ORF type:complete len:111 (-),score=24.96 TRINITY_DN9803_c0_g2_i3:1232-1564(-)